jgi:ribonuclease P protein component
MRLQFGKTRRLTSRGEFDRVRGEGSKVRGPLLSLSFLQTDDGPFRAGFVTSKRIGRAAIRNKVRRRFREIVRKHQHEIIAGTWLVVIAAPAAASVDFAALEGEWLRLAGRASILAPPCGG